MVLVIFPAGDRANAYAGAMARADTIEAVATALDGVQKRLPPTDGVKWFAWLYADVTRALVRLFHDGQMESPKFMGDLVIRFGNTFLDSVAHPPKAPRAWRPLFERRHDADVAPLQFATAGLNAHVGSELPVGLADEAQKLGVDLAADGAEHRDWQKVNSTIAAVEPGAKKYLLTGAVKELDTVFGNVDDLMATWSVEAAREAAWAQGRAVWALRDVPLLRDPYVGTLERSTAMVCRLLLVPTAV
jgi:hypothetical protein